MTYEPCFRITAIIMNNMMKIAEATVKLRDICHGNRMVHLRRTNRLRSLQSSLAIEGNSLSLDEVIAVIDGRTISGPQDEIEEVMNAHRAYESMDSIDPYSAEDILKMHRVMMGGLIESAGSFRKGDEGVFDKEVNCVHLAPGPDMVPGLMEQLLRWTRESDYHMILKSCVFHYEFESIHPFEDGNGRMGRLWQTILLSKYEVSFKWIPVESMIRSYQNRYYDAIALSNETCDCTPFIEFMTDIILKTMEKSIEETLRENIDIDDWMTVNEMRLYSMIRDGHFRNIAQAAGMLNISIPTLNRCLRSMKDHGAIRKVGNKRTGKWVVITDEMTVDHTSSNE